jgi:hypothetical protein
MEEKLCYVCSPYRGDVVRNVKYAQELTGRAVRRGLVPITPHLYITQALDDRNPEERALGMEAGLHLLEPCECIMIGGRYGISEGMRYKIEQAHKMGKNFSFADCGKLNGKDEGFLREMSRYPDMEERKQEFIHLLSFVERDGVQSLLEWLESTDFYTAPASTKYHGAYAGGLLEHSLNVFRRLVKRCPAADMDTLTVTALLHDVCKIHLYKKTEDGYRHNERFPIGHGEKSVILILRHMPLTDEEITAISWHMGAFDSRAGAGRSLSQAWEKCPLALHLHLADMEATWFDEKGGPQA